MDSMGGGAGLSQRTSAFGNAGYLLRVTSSFPVKMGGPPNDRQHG